MPITDNAHKLRVIIAFAAIYLIWGSTFYAVSIALKSFPPFLLSALRLLIAGSALLSICIFNRERIPSMADIAKNSMCGIVMFVGGIVAVVWAQQYLSSSMASIIITTPFWCVVLDKRQWNFYFSSKWIVAGLITGLVGVILLLGWRNGQPGGIKNSMEVISILMMILGSCLWVVGALYLKYNPTATSSFVGTSIQLLAAGIFCTVISTFNEEPQHIIIREIRSDSVFALLYLAIVSSLITFMAFIWLIKIKPPAIVSTYSYVNPVVAVLLGWGLGNEQISALQVVALIIILSGILLVNIPRYLDVPIGAKKYPKL
jgi:drug/metabolite transporter (DMT)-like permease